MPATGALWTWTVVRAAPPEYVGPVPYNLGVVELEGRVRLTSLIIAQDVDDLRVGARVAFSPLEIDTEHGSRLTFAYHLIKEAK